MASYDRAVVLYEQVYQRYPQSKHAAESLRNAAILRQTLGENEKAIRHFGEYARKYKDHADAKDLAFQVAVVREKQPSYRCGPKLATVERHLGEGARGPGDEGRGAVENPTARRRLDPGRVHHACAGAEGEAEAQHRVERAVGGDGGDVRGEVGVCKPRDRDRQRRQGLATR